MQFIESFIFICGAFSVFFFFYWFSILFIEQSLTCFSVLVAEYHFYYEVNANKSSGKIVNNITGNAVKYEVFGIFTLQFLSSIHYFFKFMILNLSVVMSPEVKKINYFQILKFRRSEFYFWGSFLQK